MQTEPRVIVHQTPPPINHWMDDTSGHTAVARAAQREASKLEMATARNMKRPDRTALRPDELELKKPALPKDQAERLATLDEQLLQQGLDINSDKLQSEGKTLYQKLLVVEREARAERIIGSRTDLSWWPSVRYAFVQGGAADALPAPHRTLSQQFAGRDQDLDEVRKTESSGDLWKFFPVEPRAVRLCYDFQDIFVRLAFLQSLLAGVEEDGHVHSRFYCGGGGEKVRLFESVGLAVLKGSQYYRVLVKDALSVLTFWIAGEESAPPTARELAKHFYGVRAPSLEQTELAGAVLRGFLRNLSGWRLYNEVGRALRKPPNKLEMDRLFEQLSRRSFPKISHFHREVSAAFLRPTMRHREYELDGAQTRAFTDRTLSERQNSVSGVMALTLAENAHADNSPVICRFSDSIVCAGKPRPEIAELIAGNLATAFPGASLQVNVEVL